MKIIEYWNKLRILCNYILVKFIIVCLEWIFSLWFVFIFGLMLVVLYKGFCVGMWLWFFYILCMCFKGVLKVGFMEIIVLKYVVLLFDLRLFILIFLFYLILILVIV